MANVGDTIGRFALERELGRGPLSEVFLAVDRYSGWKGAFKIFLLEPGSKPHDHDLFAQRMVREASAAAAFHHDSAVRIHEVGQLGPYPYLVRDYIEGRPLSDYVSDRSSGSLARKLHWIRELARTLADIHRAGLVHRDVKPTNVLIRRDGALRVLDFGVARRSVDRASGVLLAGGPNRSPPNAKPRVLGTPAYMAPERFGQLGTSPLGDQFGWAVLAYELLAGRLPWGDGKRALRPIRIVTAILTQQPDDLRQVVPEAPHLLGGVFLRAMAKDPKDRFPTMDYVMRSFDEAVR
jgi:serine/threonine-protein kinase